MRIIRNYDVASYYPNLMIKCGYTSRNIPSPKVFEDVVARRLEAKKSGDKTTANALKLVVNTTYGAMLNQYNDLYDPLMGRSVCITGQLFLLELANHLLAECETLRVLQLNTDGIMVSFDDSEYPRVLEITGEWQTRTGFELEEDRIKSLIQKDCNNYVEVQPNGSVKIKGGYLVRGIAPAGAFNVNNNACIVATALKEYFVNDTPVEDTINACDDIFQFQIIAKAGAKYKEAYHLVDGEQVPIQKVNRVYATTDTRYGKLYKVKAENDATAKIEMLPEHCIIDNDNQITMDEVDKTFYIDMAKKRINDFMGIKPEKNKGGRKKMTTTKKPETPSLNTFQRLLLAREKFLDANVQKSGKNMHLAFKYFELEDIVPTATRIFREVGIIGLMNFDYDTASMTIVNTENPSDERIEFEAPFDKISPITTNAGKQATNEMQALGSSITYMRRYLYMIALDICENDSIDANIGQPPVATPSPAPRFTPLNHEQRREVKQELTATDDKATALQIRGLKVVLKKLKEADPSKEELIAQIAVQTEGFTSISKADCEALIQKITGMLEGGND